MTTDTEQHVLHHGDCLEHMAGLGDGSIKLQFTSPPYNIGKEYERRTSLDDYLRHQARVIEEMARICHPEGSVCWQAGSHVDGGEVVPLDALFLPIFRR